jgi:hypothetical protein
MKQAVLLALPVLLGTASSLASAAAVIETSLSPGAAPADDLRPTDVVDFATGMLGLTSDDDPTPVLKRRFWTVLPFVAVSPLIGVGVGVGTAAVFQLGDPALVKQSRLEASFAATANHQFSLPVRSDLYLGPRWHVVGDWAWRKFPVSTWGLGGDSPESLRNHVEYGIVRVHEKVLRRVSDDLYVGGGVDADVFYAVHAGDASPRVREAFTPYPHGTRAPTTASRLSVDVHYDSRDYQVNATRGSFAAISYSVSPRSFASDSTWQSLYLDGRTYLRLARRVVIGVWGLAWLNSGDTPYFLLPSIGADPEKRSGRGYVEGRHIGGALLYGEAEARFPLWRFLGAAVAVNVHSVSEPAASGETTTVPRFVHAKPAFVAGLRALLDREEHCNGAFDVGMGADGQKGVYLNLNETF